MFPSRPDGGCALIFVSFFTPKYKDCAARLRDSLGGHKLRCMICELPEFDTWEQATHYKPKLLLQAMLTFPGEYLCWVDADAIVNEKPDHLFELEDMGGLDMAAHYFRDRELATGTLLIAPHSDFILDLWIEENEKRPKEWDQRNLQRVVEAHNLNVKRLPPEYCWIFDLSKRFYPAHKAAPVIEHFQYSREARKR